MKEEAKFKSRLTHNIIWKKWLKKKQSNDQFNQKSGIGLKKMKAFQLMDGQQSEAVKPFNSLSKQNRKSYQQFVNGIGTMKQNLNWVKVGQLNNYCITYVNHKNKILKTQNPQKLTQSKNSIRRKSFYSRASVPSVQYLKTEPISQLKQKIALKSKYPMTHKDDFKIETKQRFTKSIAVKKRKTSTQYRPWSGVEKQQFIDHSFHI